MDSKHPNETHGMSQSKHPIYQCWKGIRKRCNNQNEQSYKHYGGRGIKVCARWQKFENFRDDMLSTWQQGLDLDRTNNDGNYEPGNCRWVTRSQNCKNTRRKAEKQSKYEGVCWDKQLQIWRTNITIGYFKNEEQAAQLYIKVRDFIKENK